MAKSKRKIIEMDKLTAGYEEFLKGKKLAQNGKLAFKNAIKKAATPKSRGSK